MKRVIKKRKYCIILLLLLSFSGKAVASSDYMEVRQNVFEEEAVSPPTEPHLRPPSRAIPMIYNVITDNIKTNEVTVSWETQKKAHCQIYYGETEKYEKGTVSQNDISKSHSLKLTKLLPETRYYFKILCADSFGTRGDPVKRSFKTLPSPLPLNVSDFTAVPGDKEVELSWKNPADSNFEGVKLVRSEDFYPMEPSEGEEVYNGKGEAFTDRNLENGKRYYYTAFSYNKEDDYSSGVIASVIPYSEEEPVVTPPPDDIPVVLPIHPELEKIDINDFDFYQKGKKARLDNLEPEEPLTIVLDYDKVPEILKTIMVTLGREDNKYFSFLLRINEDKTAYTASMMPPEPGRYRLSIIIMDYKNQALKKIESFIEIVKRKIGVKESPFILQLFSKYRIALLLLLLISLFTIAIKARHKSYTNTKWFHGKL